jgi:hypothetical protein
MNRSWLKRAFLSAAFLIAGAIGVGAQTVPSAPVLHSPANGLGGQAITVGLSWNSVSLATSYEVQVSTSSNFGTTVFDQTGTTGLSATVPSLSTSTTYYWQVQAFDLSGSSGWSATWSFVTTIPSLVVPVNGVGGQSIAEELGWSAAASATSYEVQVSTSSGFGTTFFDQTGTAHLVVLQNSNLLSPFTTYYWRAQAFDAAGSSGWSGWSATWSFTTVHYVYDTVTGDNMGVLLKTSVNPTFDGVPLGNYDEIGVFSKTGLCVGDGVWNTATNGTTISVAGQDPNSGTPDGLNYGDSMFFRVWHYATQQEGPATVTFSTGGSTFNDVILDVISSLTAISSPNQPALSLPVNGLGNLPTALTLTWNTALEAASYAVQVSTSGAFSTTVVSQTGITGTSRAVSGLVNNTTYYWWVNATNSVGASAWSSVWNFTTAIAAPALASPSNGSTGQSTSLTLSWNTVTGAATYAVQVSTSSGFGSTVSSQTGVTGLSASVSGLANGATYYWEVNATNAVGTGAWSSMWSFTTIVAAPGAPTLASPSSGSTNLSTSLTLSWGTVTGAATYNVLVSTSTSFTTTVSSQNVAGFSVSVSGLADSTTYYWEVSATNAGGTGAWSSMWSFTTSISTRILSSHAGAIVPSFSFRNGNVLYTLPGAAKVEIVFYDILGRTALAISRAESAGSHIVNLKDSNLAPGRYFARLKSGSFEKQISLFLAQ